MPNSHVATGHIAEVTRNEVDVNYSTLTLEVQSYSICCTSVPAIPTFQSV